MMLSTHIRLVLLIPAMLATSCVHRIPSDYEYPAGWVSAEHQPLETTSLSGIVVGPGGAPMQHVLVERMSPDFKTRLDAKLTDSQGRFHFRTPRNGTFYLRCRMRNFNDYLVRVQVAPNKMPNTLSVQLEISN